MSERAEQVRAINAALDPEWPVPARESLTDDVEFRADPAWPESASYRGPDAMLNFLAEYYGSFDDNRLEFGEPYEVEDRVVVPWVHTGSGHGSGLAFENRGTSVFLMREGRVAELLNFFDEAEARRVARLASGRPLVMGVVNVTPDSFSDGGLYLDAEAAVAHGVELSEQGADILDVGGESTRPGAEPVPVDEELRRVVPVVEALAAGNEVSIDTSKPEVAGMALEAGAAIVNDVTAFRAAPEMAGIVAEAGATCCLMHMLGEPRTMQDDPRYDDVVSEVKAFLEERLAFAVHEGVPETRIWLDPGIGFGKTLTHNLELIRRLDEIVAIGRPVVIGTSRKRFIGTITGRPERERVAGTLSANVLALARGARVFRVHDVAAARDALDVAAATLGA